MSLPLQNNIINVNGITVNMGVNREIITPLPSGDVVYTDPTSFTTQQISEIIVLDAPVPYQRFAATAPFNSLLANRQYPSITSKGFEDLPAAPYMYPVTHPLYPYTYNLLIQRWESSQEFRYKLAEEMSRLGVWSDAALNTVASGWASLKSSAFYPQVDFFSRYNKWFASVTWMTPESSSSPATSNRPSSTTSVTPIIGPPRNVGSGQVSLQNWVWPVLFVYADRVNKVLYTVPGTVQGQRIDETYIPDGSESITILSATATGSSGQEGFYTRFQGTMNVTWRYTGDHDYFLISVNDTLVGRVSSAQSSWSASADKSVYDLGPTEWDAADLPQWLVEILEVNNEETGDLKIKVTGVQSANSQQVVSNLFSIIPNV